MILDWWAEQVTAIAMTAVEEEFGASATDVERRVPNLEAMCQQIHTAPHGSHQSRSEYAFAN